MRAGDGKLPGLPDQEKNAIFSVWLMRRMGASGSGLEVRGRDTMPLASKLDPSDGSAAGLGLGAGSATD